MVQPFRKEIIEEGEKSFVFVNNKFCHCVLKTPRKGNFLVQGGSETICAPSEDLIKQAENILTAANQKTLYARVDVIQKGDQLILMELELIEPSLKLYLHRSTADQLASAIVSRLIPV